VKLGRAIRLKQLIERQDLFGRGALKNAKPERPTRNGANGKRPVLAKYKTGGMKLRAQFNGTLVKARVRSDGIIIFKGEKFNSPSKAASVAQKKRTCSGVNGWRFWSYERAPGDWIRLRELKR
jgi:hypothetical protein